MPRGWALVPGRRMQVGVEPVELGLEVGDGGGRRQPAAPVAAHRIALQVPAHVLADVAHRDRLAEPVGQEPGVAP